MRPIIFQFTIQQKNFFFYFFCFPVHRLDDDTKTANGIFNFWGMKRLGFFFSLPFKAWKVN